MKKSHLFILALLNLASFLGMVAVNALANILPINGLKTGELSDMYPNLFVPAGITFSIWGLIYLLLLIFLIYQFIALTGKRKHPRQFIRKISLFFFFSSLLNIAWIFAWHYQHIHLSFLIMVTLLFSLILTYTRLDVGARFISVRERYFVHLPFSIYLGWISIATIANLTALLVGTGWSRWGLSEEFWTLIMMLVGTLLAVIIAFRRKDIFYGLVTVWALLGIFLKRSFSTDGPQIIAHAAILFGVLILAVHIVQIIRKKVY
jgi:hypothetical protein